jgi:hypothetical protein
MLSRHAKKLTDSATAEPWAAAEHPLRGCMSFESATISNDKGLARCRWILALSQGVGFKSTLVGGGWSTLAHWISPVFL